eukprot:6189633-Pleurochrysis_carterae.AAC.2
MKAFEHQPATNGYASNCEFARPQVAAAERVQSRAHSQPRLRPLAILWGTEKLGRETGSKVAREEHKSLFEGRATDENDKGRRGSAVWMEEKEERAHERGRARKQERGLKYFRSHEVQEGTNRNEKGPERRVAEEDVYERGR